MIADSFQERFDHDRIPQSAVRKFLQKTFRRIDEGTINAIVGPKPILMLLPLFIATMFRSVSQCIILFGTQAQSSVLRIIFRVVQAHRYTQDCQYISQMFSHFANVGFWSSLANLLSLVKQSAKLVYAAKETAQLSQKENRVPLPLVKPTICLFFGGAS
jgi:hypothetical protein